MGVAVCGGGVGVGIVGVATRAAGGGAYAVRADLAAAAASVPARKRSHPNGEMRAASEGLRRPSMESAIRRAQLLTSDWGMVLVGWRHGGDGWVREANMWVQGVVYEAL